MMFKRDLQYYTEHDLPVTAYQKAAQVWDNRLGSARVQAKNWRLIAFGLLLLCLINMVLIGWLMSAAQVTPYIVEIDTQGRIHTIAAATQLYQPSEAQITYHLEDFIKNLRSVSMDPVVVRKNWLAVYDYLEGDAVQRVSSYAQNNDPFKRIGQQTVAIDVTSIVKASDKSYQIRWIEHTYEHGVRKSKDYYTSLVTLKRSKPKTEDMLRKNPLGLYITSLNWSKDIPPQGRTQ
ncbi:MAG: conjugal transfer protein TrbF [Pseudomonadota bacterium]